MKPSKFKGRTAAQWFYISESFRAQAEASHKFVMDTLRVLLDQTAKKKCKTQGKKAGSR